ncbi:porin family protein [Maribacter sp.]|uniref:porin family protein n=1 Tax=Maribacter sp. TaxID=1897614 RepID=UPI0025C29126|nr:porin family protein [Maribacter sp.]
MKTKIYVILAFFSLGLLQMNAQVIQGTSGSSSDMRFGVKGGFNISSLGGDSAYSYDSKPGFHLGGVLEIPFSDKIIIQPEALISLQGSGGFFEDDLNFWYITVPVVAKYNVWEDLYIEAGPQLGVLFSDNLDGNSFGGGDGSFRESNTIDFGLTAGAGYRLDDNFYFQLRFNAGFLNAIDDVTSKNRVFQLSAVYFL